MGFTLRRAMPSDAAALTDCITAAYANYVAQGIDLPPVSDGIGREIRDNVVWLAVEGADLLGGVIVSVSDEIAYLTNVAVHPDHGGRGVGRALINAATKAAQEAGHSRIKLATHRLMPDNVALYEHLGWRVIHRDAQKVVMERHLV